MVTLELTFKVKRKEESDRNVLYSKKRPVRWDMFHSTLKTASAVLNILDLPLKNAPFSLLDLG